MVQCWGMIATKLDDLSSFSVPHSRRRELALFSDTHSHTVQYHTYGIHTHTHTQMHVKSKVKGFEVYNYG